MLDVTSIPPLLQQFILTALFCFVIGLELHSYRRANQDDLGFGTTRTFTLIGILGFVLYALDARGLLYGIGLFGLTGFMWIYYWRRVGEAKRSLLTSLLALLTYLVGPIAVRFPAWFLVLFVVMLLVMLGEKPGIRRFSDAFRGEETITLAKFLIMAGIILPLLPDREIAPFITVTYYQLWLAVIVVSGISYLSYLAQTYFFKTRGVLLTGLLGGLYSSTAATVVLARRAREVTDPRLVAAAVVLATAMMYVRLLALVFVLGHYAVTLQLLAPFVVFVLLSLGVVFLQYRRDSGAPLQQEVPAPRHPLELSTAVLFALLFVVFAGVTQVVITHFGAGGLHVLSFAVGFTDIDPFVLSLLAGKYQVTDAQVTGAVLVAAGSNNVLKAGYALALGRQRALVPAALWLVLLFLASIGYVHWGL